MITHLPYRSRCEHCVAHKGRQDQQHDLDHASSAETVISVDCGFCRWQESDVELATVLMVHDRHTKCVHVIPMRSKGGQFTSYMVVELVRFACWLGHREICFRSDDEKPVLALIKAAKKACRQLGAKHGLRARLLKIIKRAEGK